MRTTLILNEELVAYAKKTAADRQCSLSAVVNDALRRSMESESQHHEKEKQFRMICYRGLGKEIDTSPIELSNIVEQEDLEALQS